MRVTDGKSHLLLATAGGLAIRFAESDTRPMGRATRGVRGIKLREGDARFRVVKNSTALRAIEDLPLAGLSESFVGQTAIAFTDGDIVGVAKALREFAKEHETPNFKAGIVDGAPISVEEFEQLAKLPPRDELIPKPL